MSMKAIQGIFLAVVVAVLAFPIPAPGGAELPPSLLGYLRVENPDRMIRDLDRFLQGIDVPPLAGPVLRMALGGLIENPRLEGVDLGKPLIMASFRPDRPDAWAISLAFPSPEAYHWALLRNWKFSPWEGEGGIGVYTRETKEFDSAAFLAADPDARVNVDSFYRAEKKTLAVAAADRRAWISLHPELLRLVGPLAPEAFPAPAAGQLAVSLRAAPLLELAEESLEADYDYTASGASVLGPAAVRETNRKSLELFLRYARQLESVSLGLTLDGAGARLEEILRAVPGSPLAEFLSAQKKERLSLFRFLDPAPWLAFGGRIEKPEMTLDFYRRIFRHSEEMFYESAREKGIDPSPLWRRQADLIEDYLLRVAGDELAFSLSSSPGEFFSVFTIQRIRDREAFREYVRNSFLEDRDSLVPYYEALGITMDVSGVENPRLYRGTEIFTARMIQDRKRIQELVAAVPDLPVLPEGSLISQYAAEGSLALTAMSWGDESDLGPRLGNIAAGESTFSPAGAPADWPEANGVIYISLNRLFGDFLLPLFEREGEGEESVNQTMRTLSRLDLPLFFRLTASGPELKAELDVPISRIRAVKKALESPATGN